MRSRSCAGEKYTLLIGPRSGWLTRAGQTVRRRARRLCHNETPGPCSPRCGLLAGTFCHIGQRARRQRPRRAGACVGGGPVPTHPTAHRLGLHAKLDRSGRRVWLAGVSRRSAGGPHPAWNGASLRTDFRAYCLAACCWPWSRLAISPGSVSATPSKSSFLDHDREAWTRLGAGRRAPLGLLVVCGQRWRGHYPRSRRRSPITFAALAPRRTPAALEAVLGLALRARDLLAGRLIDDFHGEAYLAAIIEAQQLNVDFLPLFHDLAHGLGATVRELRNMYETVLGSESSRRRQIP